MSDFAAALGLIAPIFILKRLSVFISKRLRAICKIRAVYTTQVIGFALLVQDKEDPQQLIAYAIYKSHTEEKKGPPEAGLYSTSYFSPPRSKPRALSGFYTPRLPQRSAPALRLTARDPAG